MPHQVLESPDLPPVSPPPFPDNSHTDLILILWRIALVMMVVCLFAEVASYLTDKLNNPTLPFEAPFAVMLLVLITVSTITGLIKLYQHWTKGNHDSHTS